MNRSDSIAVDHASCGTATAIEVEFNSDFECLMSSSSASGQPASLVDTAFSNLLYGLSLPERLVRSVVGVTAGTAKEIAEFVVPQAFKDSKTYEIAVRNSIGFLVSGVGKVADSTGAFTPELKVTASSPVASCSDDSSATPVDQDTGRIIARKAAGSFIDIAGLSMLHVSPLWVLAIVSDVAYGSQVYLKELADELRQQGLIDETSTIRNVQDLLGAVKQASGTAASSFDQPPLSLDELQKSVEETRIALVEIDPTQIIPQAEILRYWTEMREVADREQVSLLGLSGAIAMQTLETAKDLTHGTATGLLVAGNILTERVFGHYVDALQRIRDVGLWESVKNTYAPYIDMAWGNFVRSRKTWTEQLLDPGHIGRAYNAVKGWLVGEDDNERQTNPPQ